MPLKHRAEDELSTSAGSSDNEIAVVSDDDMYNAPAHIKPENITGGASVLPLGILATFFTAFLQFLDLVRASIFGVKTLSKQKVVTSPSCYSHAHNTRKENSNCRRPLLPKKTQRATPAHSLAKKPLSCKPVNVSAHEQLSFPCRSEGASDRDQPQLSLEEVGLPPGLEDVFFRDMQVSMQRLPPGLSPPGLEDVCPRRMQAMEPFKASARKFVQQQPSRPTVGKVGPGKRQQVPVGAHPPKQNKHTACAKQSKPRSQALDTAPHQPLLPPAEPKVPVAHSLEPSAPREFELAAYRKDLSGTLNDLANGINVAVALRRIRVYKVPKERQAAEFCDILTRAAEDERGLARRLALAFAIGLANGGENSIFDREECIAGVQLFFADVVDDLAMEVPRLRNRLSNELAPLLLTILSQDELVRYVPVECRTPCN